MDECGNETVMSQTIVVTDSTAPTLTIGPDAIVECDEPVPGPSFTSDDNCGDPEVTIDETIIEGDCPQEYTLIRTYTSMDECGNETVMSQTIQVQDTTDPELEAGPNMTIECDEVVPAPEYTASDNCGDVVVTVEEEIMPGSCPQEYLLTRTYTATDECGNTTTDSQFINVVDTTDPTLVAAPDVTVECDEPVPAPDYTADDNCGEVTVTVDEDIIDGSCPQEYMIIRFYTAEDECGNIETDMQFVTIQDTTAPELEVGPDATVECDEPIPAPDYTATDNCGDVEVTIDEEMVPGQCPQEYTLVRTYIAEDACGNVTTDSQVINVVDTTAPTLTVGENVVIECDEPVPGPESTATDNCGDVTVDAVDEIIPGACPQEFTIIRTYTATDECGNETSGTQTITVQDTTAPTLTVGPNASIECDEPVPGPSFSAEDNCGDPEVTIDEEILPGDCPQEYSVIRTYTAMDECGNETVMSQTIVVSDTEAPVFNNVPGNLTVECADDIPAPANVTATDNCGDVTITLVENMPTDFCGEGLRRTWTAVDECGNTTIAEQDIFINDTTAPTLVVAADATIECDEDVPAADYTADDNCAVPTVVVTEVITPGVCPQEFTITRTYTCLLYTSPSPRDRQKSRMPSSA